MMIFNPFLKVVWLVCAVLVLQVHGDVTDAEYELMPPIFHLDNFDQCMVLGEKALYCSISIQLEPVDSKHPSQVWKITRKVISRGKNYRHDRLRHGVCVAISCPNLSANVTFFKTNHKLLKTELSKCYTKKYSGLGLKSVVTRLHCETQEPVYDIDIYDILVATILFILFVIVVIGSFYEGCARYKTKEEYDKITKTTTAGRILTCFSLPKNWERLTSINNSPDAISLRPINAIRFYSMCLVIMCHTCMVAYAGPIVNPQFFERMTENSMNMLVVNGAMSTQTFFLMAGWLLSYHFFLTFERRKHVRFSYIVIAFVNRYIRLTPSFLVTIAISSTWLYHVGRGPFWHKLVGTEFRHCRMNWWANLLYINNYYDSKHMCMQQSWYLAADTQLFLLSLVIVMLMWKYQHQIKFILGIFLATSILIPGMINYAFDYDIVVRAYPENLYNMQLDNRHWHNTYIPAHNNMSGYVVGLIFGYLFYKYRNQKILTKKFHIAIWWIITWGLPLSMIFLGVPIYKDSYQHSRTIAAIYAALVRCLYVLGIAIGIFGVSQGVGWFLRDALCWLPLQVFGRLSYCAYLIHVALIRVRGGLLRTPLYVNSYVFLNQTLGDIAMAYIFALILCLFVEMPVSALQKLLVPQLEERRKLISPQDNKQKLR
ncbi:hypothetical protein ILUMI_21863 [Ignelater luminosus]|uniref:Acyltransferase 3 domain-containing protein n=1 Tax=Ignelater luminosus TaxID=2038154 RepID=A0A8K0CEW2_IGNLU|nr:hypothetical protein ILUMI_21863 [Ignelater luminosus]